MADKKIKRRAFIATGGIAIGGLALGIYAVNRVNKKIKAYSGEGMGDGHSLNAWLRIAPDNTVTVAVARAEMGQGVYTSLPMMIAEELEVEMKNIKVIHPQPESPYANTFLLTNKVPNYFEGLKTTEKILAYIPVISTGGSTTIRDGYNNIRYAGASAREMLRRAAAQTWQTDLSKTVAINGFIHHKDTKEKLSYGELAQQAASIELKELPKLKDKSEWKIIGTPIPRIDIPEKVTGEAMFGIDVRLKDQLFAAMRHPKVMGGKIVEVLNEDEVLNQKGIKKILLTDYGAAVVADNSWRAKNAALSLQLKEESNGNDIIDDEYIDNTLADALKKSPTFVPENKGDVQKSVEVSAHQIEALYKVPYLAHAPLEPLNCTVLFHENSEGEPTLDVWTGTQSSTIAQLMAHEESGIPKENVKVHVTYLGGGFGRRSEGDYVTTAVAIAKHFPNTPVQTLYTREECMKNDMYRPAVHSYFSAAFDENKTMSAWQNDMALQSVTHNVVSRINKTISPKPKQDTQTAEGAADLPYLVPNRQISVYDVTLPIPVGFWRSVGGSQNGFFTECFMDECAEAAGKDPLAFRQELLKDSPRFLNTLNKVAEMSDWNNKNGRILGLALHKSFGSIVAEVAEISQKTETSFSIDKYYCAVDCGNYINPNTIEAQMEGGIIFALSAAMYGQINWEDGTATQSNFPQYEMVRLQTCPKIEVSIMDVDAQPGGVGEPGTPPAAPALVNAIHAATGKRIRELPLLKAGITFV